MVQRRGLKLNPLLARGMFAAVMTTPESTIASDVSVPMNIPAGLNFGIILAQLVAIGGCFYAAAHVRGWELVVLALFFGVLMNSVYSIIHEAEHAILFPGRVWN